MKTKIKTVKVSPKRLSVRAPVLAEEEMEYNKDFFKWTRDQMKFLKNQEFEKVDIDNLVEEIESLGNSEKNAIESHLIILFLHLLKIEYQPAMSCKSWSNSVENAKFRITRLIQKNPSLRKKISELLPDAYFSARLRASSETGLEKETFPEECPWTAEAIFQENIKNNVKPQIPKSGSMLPCKGKKYRES